MDFAVSAPEKYAQFKQRYDDFAKTGDKASLATLHAEVTDYIDRLVQVKMMLDGANLNRRQKRTYDRLSHLIDQTVSGGFYDLITNINEKIVNIQPSLPRPKVDTNQGRITMNEPQPVDEANVGWIDAPSIPQPIVQADRVVSEEVNPNFTPQRELAELSQLHAFIAELRDGNADLTTAEGQAQLADVLEFLLEGRGTASTESTAKEAKKPKEREPQYHTEKSRFLRTLRNVFAQHGVVTLATVLEFVAHPKKPELRGQREPQFVKEARERISERGAFNEFMREAKNRTSDMRFRNAEDFANVYNQILTEKSPIYLDKISMGAMLLLAQELGVLNTSFNIEKITDADDLDEAQALEAKLKKIIGANEQWKSGEPKHEALKNFLKLSQLEALFGNGTPNTTASTTGAQPVAETSTSSSTAAGGQATEAAKPSELENAKAEGLSLLKGLWNSFKDRDPASLTKVADHDTALTSAKTQFATVLEGNDESQMVKTVATLKKSAPLLLDIRISSLIIAAHEGDADAQKLLDKIKTIS